MVSVLVTGTSSGIGLATALVLARAGHRVYATVRNPDRASELSDKITVERLPVSILTMDVDSDESVARAINRIEGESIEALVNYAGIGLVGSVEELPMEAFRAVMETNYFGALRCIRAVLPRMRERRSGCIINVTSVAGRIASSPFAPYTASKFALEALSEVLAQEVKAFNVRVAIVEPGIIDTPMAQRVTTPPTGSTYPQTRRMAGLFRASLVSPTSPTLVAETIREIIESETWRVRHPVGPSARPFLDWRAAMTDEAWVEFGALEDEAWFDRVQTDFGLDVRALV